MDKFCEKYRISSARLQDWDYSWAAAYFVTICAANRDCVFGNIMDGKMQLSNVGVLADVFWAEIRNHAKNIELDVFVVMPNHVHGILILNGNDDNIDDGGKPILSVETRHALSLQPDQTIGQRRFQNQGVNTLSSIIGSYKSAVSRHAHRLGYKFEWQSRFHDHIIRDLETHHTIQEYIVNNPQNWDKDKFFQ